jgi:hypothetical protein
MAAGAARDRLFPWPLRRRVRGLGVPALLLNAILALTLIGTPIYVVTRRTNASRRSGAPQWDYATFVVHSPVRLVAGAPGARAPGTMSIERSKDG